MKDISSLKKKLAGYSAIASVMLAANNHKAEAQVIYHDIVPDTVLSYFTPTYELDLNNDSIVDFGFSWTTALATFDRYGIVYPYTSDYLLRIPSGFNLLDKLNSCETISAIPPDNDIWNFDSEAMFQGGGVWTNYGEDGYAGLKFHLPDGNHYGWIRMTCIPEYGGYDGYMILKDYAYEAIPDSSILTPCANQVKDIASPNLFNAFVENQQLIIRFHQSPLPSQVFLFNDLGMKLREQAITQSELVMDVSQLAAGIYFVVVDGNEKRQVKKVVIE